MYATVLVRIWAELPNAYLNQNKSRGQATLSQFEYVVVITSIIVGLAIAQLMQGVAQSIQHSNSKPVYWVHLTWAATILLNIVWWWWAAYSYRETPIWTIQRYAFVLGFASLYYVICAVLFPKSLEGFSGYKEFFYARRAWIFGLIAAYTLIDLLEFVVKGYEYFSRFGLEYVITSSATAILCIVGAISRNERFHAIFAVTVFVYYLTYVLRMYQTL